MGYNLKGWFKIHHFPTGRRVVAQRQVLDVAGTRGLEVLAEHCEQAIAHEQLHSEQRLKLLTIRNHKTDTRLTQLDPDIDRTVGSIYRGALEAQRSLKGPGAKAGADIVKNVFPEGAIGITNKSYPDQSSSITTILRKLRTTYADQVSLLGLGIYVDQLEDLNGRFSTILDEQRNPEVTTDQVRESDQRGQDNLLKTLAIIFGAHYTDSDEDVAARAELLGPIDMQNQQIYDYLRRRRSVEDVDPTTGEETVGVVPEQPVTGTETPTETPTS